MDLRIIFITLSMMYSGIFHSVASAPAETLFASTSTPVHHARTKRCSCATFLDKECVYFCHLDIIWVNTPERVVSYGLGNAPRRKRSISGPVVTKQDARCKCLRKDDKQCTTFCQRENHHRYQAAPDKVILSAEGDDCAETQCKHNLAAKASRIKR
ncbi:endothelin-1 [Aplochiton taeniatus]